MPRHKRKLRYSETLLINININERGIKGFNDDKKETCKRQAIAKASKITYSIKNSPNAGNLVQR